MEYDLHYKENFGQYVHTHIDPDRTNKIQNSMFPGIYLGPTRNMQGTVKVLVSETRKVKKPKMCTEVSMPGSVMKLVNSWGKTYQKPKENNCLSLEIETRKNTCGSTKSTMTTQL